MSKNILLYRLLKVLKFYFSTLDLSYTAEVSASCGMRSHCTPPQRWPAICPLSELARPQALGSLEGALYGISARLVRAQATLAQRTASHSARSLHRE